MTAAGEKPTGTLSLNTGWTHHADIIDAAFLDENSGTPAFENGASVVFSGDIAWATVGSDIGVQVGDAGTGHTFTAAPSLVRAEGTEIVLYNVVTADSSNVATLIADSSTNSISNIGVVHGGPPNTRMEAGNNVITVDHGSALADNGVFGTTGFKVLVYTRDSTNGSSPEGGSVGRRIYLNSEAATGAGLDWAASTAYSVGDWHVPLNDFCYRCTTAGTSAASTADSVGDWHVPLND